MFEENNFEWQIRVHEGLWSILRQREKSTITRTEVPQFDVSPLIPLQYYFAYSANDAKLKDEQNFIAETA